jgi:hypothetical protein
MVDQELPKSNMRGPVASTTVTCQAYFFKVLLHYEVVQQLVLRERLFFLLVDWVPLCLNG